MLVYSNKLCIEGPEREDAVVHAIGLWMKEKLGFGLRPDQLTSSGEYQGKQDKRHNKPPARLKIVATDEEDPGFFSWVLKHADHEVQGRQWVVEIGAIFRTDDGLVPLSVTIRVEDASTQVAAGVIAAQPRIIRHLATLMRKQRDARFCLSTAGTQPMTVRNSAEDYNGLLAEIERKERGSPIVLISPDDANRYLLNPGQLQSQLLGLAQVVTIDPKCNSFELADTIGPHWSAYKGAVNIIHPPTCTGFIRGQRFLADDIRQWGVKEDQRIHQLVGWVTNITNVPLSRQRIRPEGVQQLAMARRLQTVRARSEQMDADQLRGELERMSADMEELKEWTRAVEDDNDVLTGTIGQLKNQIDEGADERRRLKGKIQQIMTGQWGKTGQGASTLDSELLLNIASTDLSPSPRQCLEIIESIYGDKCQVLGSALDSADQVEDFINGRALLNQLQRLVTDYRDRMMQGGDSQARQVFGGKEYSARESETVMNNPALSRYREFDYDGNMTTMQRHLRIGVDDDTRMTIRTHFHWDANKEIIVIGYCGEHLPVSSH